MRALCIFGSVALYILCALVPPSQANFRAFTAMAKDLSSLDSTAIVSRVAGALDQTNARSAVDAAYSNAVSLVPDSKTVLKTVAHSVIGANGGTTTLALLANAERDNGLRLQFERMLWASSNHDPRLCNLLSEFYPQKPEAGLPTLGDLLALCLAETTREANRCGQIDPVTAPALLETCRKDLEIQI